MPSLSECHEPGLLLVHTRPRSSAHLNDFHNWYDTEHGPARLKLDFVENGCRYKCADDASIWAAMYDLKRVSATAESRYTNLRRHRSSREQYVMQNVVDVLDRKIYKHLSTRGHNEETAPVVTCVSFVVGQEDLEETNRWYEEQHLDDLSRIPGWRRSRRFQVVDGDVLPGCVELLAIHDFDANNGLGGPEHMRARHRPWRERIVRLAKSRVNKQFNLYHQFRAEDYVAPPDLQPNTYVRRQDSVSTRRSSLASGHEFGETLLNGIGIHQTALSEVH